jgi:hypothetical protein
MLNLPILYTLVSLMGKNKKNEQAPGYACAKHIALGRQGREFIHV